ncbi:WD40 repeat domain-containing serine/threonine protein kinase [Singulisphaera sp. PoT]|uniref:WD40 repeat domain-containing serine/threonine protein kinase n=1 Tax=Singulisphaera sp. PoT TaxID=3411797 RepID=UPI003BF4973D
MIHEHVTAIHSVAVDARSGLPYLVMPCIAGCSLQERIDRDGPMEAKDILRIGMQAAAGLAAAHSQGLVHRDVKPSNILLEDDMERVKLTDFGLARAADDASLTQSGVVAGTPQYMSPEQARGEAVDARSDLFSLGSVLYAMVASRPPFRAETPLAVLRRVRDEHPTPLREIEPEVPGWLAAVVEKLHAKEPAEHYQSAAEVSDLLGSLLADLQGGVPIRLSSPSTRGITRRGHASLLAATLACCALAGLAIALADESTAVRCRVAGGDVHDSYPASARSRERIRVGLTQAMATALLALFGWIVIGSGGEVSGRGGESHEAKGHRAHPLQESIASLVFAPDGRSLFLASRTSQVMKWGLESSRVSFSAAWSWYPRVAISPDGRTLAATGSGSSIGLWDAEDGATVGRLEIEGGRFHRLAFSPDGRTLALAGSDGGLALWDVGNGMVRAREQAGQFIGALAYAPDGRGVATGGLDGTVTLRDAESLERLHSFRAQSTHVNALAFSPRGGLLATSGDGCETVRVWDANAGRLLATLPGHARGVPALAFSPDGSILAAATGGGMVHLWDSRNWIAISVLEGPKSWLGAIAFSPDGRSLAAAGDDRMLRIWDCQRLIDTERKTPGLGSPPAYISDSIPVR